MSNPKEDLKKKNKPSQVCMCISKKNLIPQACKKNFIPHVWKVERKVENKKRLTGRYKDLEARDSRNNI